MDKLKDLFDALSERIRTPVFSYVIFSFAVFNWKGIFYIIFSENEVRERFEYLEQSTNWATSFVLPIVTGLAIALAAPWISLLGTMWAQIPIKKKRILTIKLAHEVSRIKNELREEQAREVDSIIKAAKQDIEVQRIENEQLREEVRQRIGEIRSAESDLNVSSGARQSTTLDKTDPYDYQSDRILAIKMLEKKAELAAANGYHQKAQILLSQAASILGAHVTKDDDKY